MKKAIGLIFSGIIMLPAIAWGASAVKTLGGSGTYTGVTSVGSGATGTKTGTRVLRAGSVRTTPTVKTGTTTTTSSSGTTTTSSGNSQNRMSIGKYLSGTGVISASSGSSPSGAPSHGGTSELERDVQALHDKLADLEAAGYITSDDIDEYLKTADLNLDGYVTDAELNDYVKSDAIKDFLTADALTGFLTDAELSQKGFLTADDLTGFLTDAELAQRGYLTDAALAEKGFLTDADLDLDKYLVNDATNPYIKQSALDSFLVDDETNPYVKTNDLGTQVANKVTSELEERDLVTSSDLNDYVKSTELNLDSYLVNDAENPYVQQSALDGYLVNDAENPYIQQSALDGFLTDDTENPYIQRSYIDTIVNKLELAQNDLSEQIQDIQVSNMPEVPACSDGSCTYMLLDNGGEAKTWKQMSVVDEFDATKMN